MNTLISTVAVAAALMLSAPVSAATQALGFQIGVSSADQVKAALARQTRIEDRGTNAYSQGPMFKTDGSSYEIEGLNSVLYIFDSANKLSAVIMDMDKSRFAAVFKTLSSKYKLTGKKLPFVGDQQGRFKTDDAVIVIDAPHMSFQMEVRYIRDDLMQKYNSKSAADAETRKTREAAKF